MVSRYILEKYNTLRRNGMQANFALNCARTIDKFFDLEDSGLVRICAEPDEMPYDPGDCLDGMSEKSQERFWSMINDRGVWNVRAEYRLPDTDEWETADSICGCAGYSDPTSWRENWYVSDLMASAVSALDTYTI